MKKTAIAMLTLVTGIVAASCQKEAEPEIKSFEPMTINAVSEGIGTATKTEMAYKYDILWSEDDQIYVTDGTSNDTFTLSDGEGTTKGTFTQDGTASFTSEVQAYYPATMVQNGGLVWPATQTNNQTVPMYSTKTVSGNVEDFNFTSLGSVLQIVFNSKQENVTLRSIEIKDGGKSMSGAFTVDSDGKANIIATDNAGITLDLGTGVVLGKAANYFNIAVPAGNYQDLTIVFTATDGLVCVMKNGKVNIEHNTVGRLTLTGTKFKHAEITGTATRTGNIEVNWVQLWDGGPRFAEYNVGAANNKAEDVGGYYNWGMSSVQTAENANYYQSGEFALIGNDDTASNLWGSNWRMPTEEEFRALVNAENCTCTWTAQNGVNGLLCTGKEGTAFASNSVFFPAAGYCRFTGTGCEVGYQGSHGYYWSSTPVGSEFAYYLNFFSGVKLVINSTRLSAYSVRAVLAE